MLFHTVWVQIQLLKRIVYTSLPWAIRQNSPNCTQITATPGRTICNAAESSQMPYTAKHTKINNCNAKIKKILELRLVRQASRSSVRVAGSDSRRLQVVVFKRIYARCLAWVSPPPNNKKNKTKSRTCKKKNVLRHIKMY